MPKNTYNPNETPEQRLQQNERVKRLLEKWMATPAWNCNYTAIESELDDAGFQLTDPPISKTQVSHVPVA